MRHARLETVGAFCQTGTKWRRKRHCAKPFCHLVTSDCDGPLVMTAQTMSFRYELTCKGFSVEKVHHLVT